MIVRPTIVVVAVCGCSIGCTHVAVVCGCIAVRRFRNVMRGVRGSVRVAVTVRRTGCVMRVVSVHVVIVRMVVVYVFTFA